MRLAWVTDIHLNFADLATWDGWVDSIRLHAVDGLLVTGDISESDDVAWHLDRIQSHLELPTYFVLGNHDYYRSSIASVRKSVRQFVTSRPRLHYLTGSPPIALDHGWQLVGHDGWGDAQLGDYKGSRVRMVDFELIADVRAFNKEQRFEVLKRLGEESAEQLRNPLEDALVRGSRVLVLTHIPPFAEACWYQGIPSHPDWLPYFTCDAIGKLLLEMAERFLDRQILVLCGHTHHAGRVRMRPNLDVWTGAAEYREPRIADILDLSADGNKLG